MRFMNNKRVAKHNGNQFHIYRDVQVSIKIRIKIKSTATYSWVSCDVIDFIGGQI